MYNCISNPSWFMPMVHSVQKLTEVPQVDEKVEFGSDMHSEQACFWRTDDSSKPPVPVVASHLVFELVEDHLAGTVELFDIGDDEGAETLESIELPEPPEAPTEEVLSRNPGGFSGAAEPAGSALLHP